MTTIPLRKALFCFLQSSTRPLAWFESGGFSCSILLMGSLWHSPDILQRVEKLKIMSRQMRSGIGSQRQELPALLLVMLHMERTCDISIAKSSEDSVPPTRWTVNYTVTDNPSDMKHTHMFSSMFVVFCFKFLVVVQIINYISGSKLCILMPQNVMEDFVLVVHP